MAWGNYCYFISSHLRMKTIVNIIEKTRWAQSKSVFNHVHLDTQHPPPPHAQPVCIQTIINVVVNGAQPQSTWNCPSYSSLVLIALAQFHLEKDNSTWCTERWAPSGGIVLLTFNGRIQWRWLYISMHYSCLAPRNATINVYRCFISVQFRPF